MLSKGTFLTVLCSVLAVPGLLVVQAQPASSTEDTLPWWNETVFYQVFVRSFADASHGTLACDGIGDLNGLIERLDYLNDGDPHTTDDLGVTGLWLMPVMESPSYHGYDIVDYRTVERDYGSNEDFKRLIKAAHARGIKVIIDMVINHTSDAHPWFADASDFGGSYRPWYLYSKEKNDWKGPWGQTVWHERVGEWYYGVFGPHMPDLNFRNPEVTEAIYELSRFWLEEMGVDGFRLDAIRHLIEEGPVQENTPETHEWLQQYYRFYKALDPDVLTVGEVWSATENVAPYVRDKELDLAFEFDLAGSVLGAVQSGERGLIDRQMQVVEEAYPPFQFATFLRNHDQSRTMTVLNGDVGQAKATATILLTLPGVPFLYYGEEIGMVGPKPDPKIRTPMQWTSGLSAGFTDCSPWQAVNEDYREVNVRTQSADSGSLLNLYRQLIHLRNAHQALQTGRYEAVETDTPAVLAFSRQADNEGVLVIVNLSADPISRYTLSGAIHSRHRGMRVQEILWGTDVSVPEVAETGSFSGYQPIGLLAPQTGYIVKWVE